MKKIVCIMLTLLLILSMAIPVAAVTPTLDTPAISIPDISGSVHVELADGFLDGYLDEHPVAIEPTEEPTELRPLPNLSISHPSWWEWMIGKYFT